MSGNDTARATVGLEKLVVWPLVTDTTEELVYGDAYEFDKVLMSAQDDPSVSEGNLNADNVEVEHVTAIDGGKLAIAVTDLTTSERVLLFAETLDNGTNVSNAEDFSGYVAVAYMTNRADKKVNLKKFFKVKFIPGSESNATKEKGGVKYDTQQITGNYCATIHNGNVRALRKAVDKIEDAEIVSKWFSNATYIAPGNVTETTSSGDDEAQG